MPHQKLTQAVVDRLPFTDATTWYHDTDLAGLNLAVGRRSKTYYAGCEAKGRFLRVKIGRADLVQVNVARALARDVLLPEMRAGVDPRSLPWSENDDARTATSQEARTTLRGIRFVEAAPVVEPEPTQGETFGQAWHEFRHHGSTAKSGTLVEYDRILRTKVPEWFDMPVTSITPEEVLKQWRRNARAALPSAKALMRIASAVFHDAQRRGVIDKVPTTSLPRGWSTPKRNPKRIKDVFHWWRAVDQLDLYPKSALKVLLLTGLRVGEVLSLRWEDVDLERSVIHVRDPKRGPSRDVAVSSWTLQQFKRLHRLRDVGTFVFPSHGHKGYLLSLPTITYKEHRWRPKDTRNEWDSVAVEIGIDHTRRARQMGHSAGSMTDSYVVAPDMRGAVQDVADEIMRRVEGAV